MAVADRKRGRRRLLCRLLPAPMMPKNQRWWLGERWLGERVDPQPETCLLSRRFFSGRQWDLSAERWSLLLPAAPAPAPAGGEDVGCCGGGCTSADAVTFVSGGDVGSSSPWSSKRKEGIRGGGSCCRCHVEYDETFAEDTAVWPCCLSLLPCLADYCMSGGPAHVRFPSRSLIWCPTRQDTQPDVSMCNRPSDNKLSDTGSKQTGV